MPVPVASSDKHAPFAVITGASAGIGEATARLLANQGYRLLLGARRIDKLSSLAEQLSAQTEVHAYNLDVCDDDSVSRFCQHALELSEGKISALINNAGLAKGVAPLAEGSINDWQTVLDTNVMGVLRVTRGLLPAMHKAKHGHIVMLSSIAAELVYEGGSVYCASKHALRALTKTLRLELNGTPIRVTSIEPGLVETEFSQVRLEDTDKAKAVYAGLKPLSGHDVAECIQFALDRPAHVNIEEIMLMPIAQAAPHKVARQVGEA